MTTAILMPTFGMTEGEATVLRWFKEPGQTVVADEPLFEAEMEKATIKVPAPGDGVLLSIVVEAGQTIKLTGVVGWLGQPEEIQTQTVSVPTPQRASEPMIPEASRTAEQSFSPTPTEGGESTWIKASPIARKIACEHSIDLAKIKGSGPSGRVLEKDVREVVATLMTKEPASPIAPSDLQPLSSVRSTTARRMTESFQSAPHFYLQVEILAKRLVDLRAQLSKDGPGGLPGISYTALFARAIALTLPVHPLLNAAWEDGKVRVYRETHLGIAVAAPQGLVVPVIHRAESLALGKLNEQIARLAGLAREGHLTQADVTGGTFTLTNLGMFGVDEFIPILNPPQSAILATGAIVERPVGQSGLVVLKPTLHLTLTADHRVLDGIEAALFLRDLRELLENPARMLV